MKNIRKVKAEIGRHIVAIQDTRKSYEFRDVEQQEIARCLGLAIWQLEAALEMIQAVLKKEE